MKGTVCTRDCAATDDFLGPSKRPDNAAGAVFGKRGNGFSGWSKSKSALDAKLKTLAQNSPLGGYMIFVEPFLRLCMTTASSHSLLRRYSLTSNRAFRSLITVHPFARPRERH